MVISRRWIVLASVVLALGLGAVLALSWVTQRLHTAVLEALGPQARLGRIDVGWSAIELHDLVITARPGSGWPTAQELSARRIRITPDLRSLWPGQPWRLRAIEVDEPRLTLLRRRDGSLGMLPSLLQRPAGPGAPATGTPAPAAVVVGEIRLRQGHVDYFDATLGNPPHRMALAALQADIGPLQLPRPDGPVPLALSARLEGPTRAGTLKLDGRMSLPPRDGALALRLRGADLLALQPYLLGRGDAALRRGALDLDIDANLDAARLKAPGRVVLSDLQWRDDNPLASVAGVPRAAVTKVLARDGRIELRFSIDGRIDDPRFSVNENLAGRFAVGLAESLGVSAQGLVQGIGGMVKGLFGR
ncbi:MAG: DUF748 domain-containing protein [Aquabacterium sp.]